jgi:pyridinium-3,5-biscarboxylic acid mononucleotide sulfurtransferase
VSRVPLADAPVSPTGEAGAGVNQPGAGLEDKHRALRRLLDGIPSLIIAYSGGVDSAFLAHTASEVLGSRALCVTADSASYPDRHRRMALDLAERFGFHHEIIHTGELERPEYRANPANRCYYCKHELYSHLTAMARQRGIAVIADGSNADDRGDYRPGRQAAREFGVRSPLDEVGLAKDEIRELSRRAGLPTWDEPASACLSSRIPYFSEVTDEKLRTIERAEEILRDLGFRVCRVRHHETMARIELGRDEMARALDADMAATIDRELRALGYQHVVVDLRGYRLGSLNDALRLRPV